MRFTAALFTLCLSLSSAAGGQSAQAQFAGVDPDSDPVLAQAYQYLQSGQYDQVLALLGPLAELGNAPAQFVLGGLYSQGKGVPQDDEQAALWWRRAAEQGMARAQNEIGVALSDGRGVPADPKQAVVWYCKAADQDYTEAQYALGAMYARGAGVRADNSRAAYWFARAARSGHELAEKNLELVVPWLRRVQMHAATEVREKPDGAADVIKTTGDREYAYELTRLKDWVEVYFKDGHTVGYISAEQLRKTP